MFKLANALLKNDNILVYVLRDIPDWLVIGPIIGHPQTAPDKKLVYFRTDNGLGVHVAVEEMIVIQVKTLSDDEIIYKDDELYDKYDYPIEQKYRFKLPGEFEYGTLTMDTDELKFFFSCQEEESPFPSATMFKKRFTDSEIESYSEDVQDVFRVCQRFDAETGEAVKHPVPPRYDFTKVKTVGFGDATFIIDADYIQTGADGSIEITGQRVDL